MVARHYFSMSKNDKYDSVAKREINKELGFHYCEELGTNNLEKKNFSGVNGET